MKYKNINKKNLKNYLINKFFIVNKTNKNIKPNHLNILILEINLIDRNYYNDNFMLSIYI